MGAYSGGVTASRRNSRMLSNPPLCVVLGLWWSSSVCFPTRTLDLRRGNSRTMVAECLLCESIGVNGGFVCVWSLPTRKQARRRVLVGMSMIETIVDTPHLPRILLIRSDERDAQGTETSDTASPNTQGTCASSPSIPLTSPRRCPRRRRRHHWRHRRRRRHH